MRFDILPERCQMNINDMKVEDITWFGKKITELNRDELLKCILSLMKSSHRDKQFNQNTIDMMKRFRKARAL